MVGRILAHEEPIIECERQLRALQKSQGSNCTREDIASLKEKLATIKQRVYSSLTPWQRVEISRHPERPRSIDYIENCFDDFFQLRGDRLYGDDPAIITGLASLGGNRCAIIAQEKGRDTSSRLKRNFGMAHPEGFRKAARVMTLAERLAIPVVALVDTPGAYPGLDAEERGQGWAIASNLEKMALLKVPILVNVIGEGCSGGALGIALGDHISIFEHAYYTVISPEGCASILWKDAAACEEASRVMRLDADSLLEFGIVDEIIPEPVGGAHHNQIEMFSTFKQHLARLLACNHIFDVSDLLSKRFHRYRTIGAFKMPSYTLNDKGSEETLDANPSTKSEATHLKLRVEDAQEKGRSHS